MRRLKHEMEDDEDMRRSIGARQRLVLMMNSATWCLQRLLHTMAAASASWEVITRAEYADVLQSLYFDQPPGDVTHISTGAVSEVTLDVAPPEREKASSVLDAPEVTRGPELAPSALLAAWTPNFGLAAIHIGWPLTPCCLESGYALVAVGAYDAGR